MEEFVGDTVALSKVKMGVSWSCYISNLASNRYLE